MWHKHSKNTASHLGGRLLGSERSVSSEKSIIVCLQYYKGNKNIILKIFKNIKSSTPRQFKLIFEPAELDMVCDCCSFVILELSAPEYSLCLFEILVKAYRLHASHIVEGLGTLKKPSGVSQPT